MKRVLLCITGLLLASTAWAQVGVRAGVNAATFATSLNTPQRRATATARLGYQASLFYRHQLSQHWAVVPEVQLSYQKSSLDVADHSASIPNYLGYVAQYRLNLTYLQLPVLVRASYGKFFGQVGPQVSYRVAAQRVGTMEVGSVVGPQYYTFNVTSAPAYRRADVGLCAGVGVQLPAGLGLEIRGYTGFVSLTPARDGNSDYTGKLRTQTLQASVSYLIKLRS